MSPVQAGLAVTPLAGVALLLGARAPSSRSGWRPGSDRWRSAAGRGGRAGQLLRRGRGFGLDRARSRLVLAGFGIGVALPVLVAAALGSAPPERSGMASGAVNTFRQLGFAFGIAVLGTVFSARVHDVVAGSGQVPAGRVDGAADAISGGHADAVVRAEPRASGLVHEAFASGLDRICLVAGSPECWPGCWYSPSYAADRQGTSHRRDTGRGTRVRRRRPRKRPHPREPPRPREPRVPGSARVSGSPVSQGGGSHGPSDPSQEGCPRKPLLRWPGTGHGRARGGAGRNCRVGRPREGGRVGPCSPGAPLRTGIAPDPPACGVGRGRASGRGRRTGSAGPHGPEPGWLG
ncbi:hypothetical protein NKH77_26290 [Streptomyces sp. M19]